MPDIYWPEADVPYGPQRDPYTMTRRRPDLIVTEMEDGPVRQRPTSTAEWSQHNYVIRMTLAQFAIFDTFVALTLGKGAARFWMPVTRISQAKPWPHKYCYLERGQFTVKPEAQGYVLVSFVLNVLDW